MRCFLGIESTVAGAPQEMTGRGVAAPAFPAISCSRTVCSSATAAL